jgi:two-component sensor histidine kinase/ligand-binding sensor domain-containing protein
MSYKPKITILLVLLFACSLTTPAQQFYFRNFTIHNGLGSTSVNNIFQDSKGYIWFANQLGGVSKFDGKNFITLTTANGLINNDATYITEDKFGHIWIGTASGVSMFNGTAFKNYGSKEGLTDKIVYCIYVDSDNTKWFATAGDGVLAMDKSGKIKSLTTQNGLKHNNVFTITADRNNTLWFGHNKWFAKYENKEIFDFTSTDLRGSDRIFFTSFTDAEGNVWLGTTEGNIVIHNPKSGFRNFELPAPFNQSFISSITQDRHSNMWFATSAGVLKYDGKNFKVFNEQNGLSSNAAQTILCDYENNIWVGTLSGGVNLISSDAFSYFSGKEGLQNNNISYIQTSPNHKSHLVGTSEGLYEFLNNRLKKIQLPDALSSESISCISTDKQQNIWVCTASEIFVLKEDDGNYQIKKRYRKIGNKEIIAPQNIVHDNDRNTWIATFGSGLLVFNDSSVQVFDPSNSIVPDDVLSVHADSKNNIWIGTLNDGVIKFNGNTFKKFITKNQYKKQTVWSIESDNKQLFFFGTSDSGICVFDGNKISFITAKDGLSSNHITSLLWDEKHNALWAGSEKGLNKIDFNANKRVSAYTQRDGFNSSSINPNGISIDANGILWLATVNGLWQLNPLLDFRESSPPKIQLKNIRLFYENASWLEFADSIDVSTTLPINLKLSHNKNHLTFDIQALTTDEVRYSFILEGQDERWSIPDVASAITYTNLLAGQYTFKAKAINGNHQVSKEFITYSFTINPPWWLTWWFRLLVISALIVSLILFIKWREYALRQQNVKLEQTIKVRTHELAQQKVVLEETLSQKEILLKEKEMLMKEIHHRVKNNLQSISSILSLQSMVLKDEAAKSAIAESQNRVRSIALVHQRLYQAENIEKVELKSFIEDLAAEIMKVFQHHHSNVVITLNVEPVFVLSDKAISLGLMLNEMLTNSFKYAFNENEKGEIVIDVSVNVDLADLGKKMIVLVYCDSGKGIQNENPLESSETLGLRLIKLLSQQIRATVQYSNLQGSRFTIAFEERI